MRICGKCRQPLRFDESYERLELPEGNYAACPRCVALAAGQEPPEPRRYPRDECPTVGLHFPICGLCRVALFESDNALASHLQLTDEDVAGTEIEPGGYALCRDCRQQFDAARLARRRERELFHSVVTA